jgi:glutamyl-tRNA reductase
VLGETQILGQVREAYELSQQLGAAGAVLNPLFQRALAVGKQVMRETRLAEGRLSVASIAVDYARRIFEQFSDKTVLSIGAGKMSQLVLH